MNYGGDDGDSGDFRFASISQVASATLSPVASLKASFPMGLNVPFARDLLSHGGDDGIRTHDPLLAGQVLSQLSYTPVIFLTEWFGEFP